MRWRVFSRANSCFFLQFWAVRRVLGKSTLYHAVSWSSGVSMSHAWHMIGGFLFVKRSGLWISTMRLVKCEQSSRRVSYAYDECVASRYAAQQVTNGPLGRSGEPRCRQYQPAACRPKDCATTRSAQKISMVAPVVGLIS